MNADDVNVAFEPGEYSNFTGWILYGMTDALVENATFRLECQHVVHFDNTILYYHDDSRMVVFDKGVFVDGTLGLCIWRNGVFRNGKSLAAIWRNGLWENGEWMDGTWKGGRWLNGTWHNGEWFDGTWCNGTWKAGIWYDGVWINGTGRKCELKDLYARMFK